MKISKNAGIRISVIISIQIILIISSVLILTIYESQNTLLGNSINVAGKNRFYIESVNLEVSKYRLGDVFEATPILQLSLLNDNIKLLKNGGTDGVLELIPLPNEFESDYNDLFKEYLKFAGTVRQISNIKDSGNDVAESDVLKVTESAQSILGKSHDLTDALSDYSELRSKNLILLQIVLSAINIGTHLLLIFLIIRIVNLEFENRIKLENQVTVLEKRQKDERLRAIGELSASIAHDIRNPLAIIRNEIDLFSISNKDKDSRNRFEKISKATDRIEFQVQNILGFLKKTPLEITEFNLDEFFTDLLASIKIPKNIKIEKDFLVKTITADKSKLEAILTNIITNAIQAIDQNDGMIKISIKMEMDSTIISIENSGPSIPTNMLDKIFEPLFTTKQIGTGLGLSSCKNMIEQHGGKITVKNNPTTFTITLPVKSKIE